MTIPLVFVLTLAAALLAWRKRRRPAAVLGMTAGAVFLIVGYGLAARPLPRR